MRASAIFSVLFSAVAVLAHGGHRGNMTDHGEWTTTEIVTQYTTYCPHPTTIVQNNQTYTITEATTLTITNCPCTLTKTYTTITETICPGGCVHPTETPIVKPTGHSNVTSTYVAPEPTIVQPNVTVGPTPPPFTGAAVSNNKVTLAGGALAALVGVAAYLL